MQGNTIGSAGSGEAVSADTESTLGRRAWADFLTHLQVAACVCDPQGYVRAFNPAAVALWGRSPDIGRDLWCGSWRIFRPDGRALPADECPMAVAIRERRPVQGEEIIIERPAGERRHLRVFPSPILDPAGNFEGAINLLVDITAYKDANHAKGRLTAIVQSSDDAIVGKDLNGVITSWNRGAQRIFGYTAEETIGHSITMLMPPDRVSEEPGVLARIRRGESVEHYETVRQRKDGMLLDISLTVSPIYDTDGTIIGASKIARDITDRKRAEKALADADRRKDEFIATLAHELRNPLAPLKTSLHLIRMTGFKGEVPRSTLEMMDRQVNHLVSLVEDLLDLSRLTHGVLELRKARLDLADVVKDAVEICTPLIKAKSHHLDLLLSQPTPQVTADRTRLVQILANLLNNAAKFTPANGRIRLSVERKDNAVLIRCSDNGMGIPPEMRELVFDMFTRVTPSGDSNSGLGIGLWLTKRLVEQHGGTLELRSDGLGQGCEFLITLPDSADPLDPPSSADFVLDAAPQGRRILIVDDNLDAAESLNTLFRSLGHVVEVAGSGQAALDAGGRIKPDVILLDIGLPDMTGHEVAAKMRQEPWGKAALLIALTGWGQALDRQRSADSGFDHHLVKPVDIDQLIGLVGTLPPAPALR